MRISPSAKATAGGNATLLLVEDHPAVRAAVTDLLAGALSGCRVLATDCAETALELCRTEAPDLVIMDLLLPGINGLEATRSIKALFPGIVVVMHSANDMALFREESLAAGASGFVGKGRGSAGLVPLIASLLAAAATPTV